MKHQFPSILLLGLLCLSGRPALSAAPVASPDSLQAVEAYAQAQGTTGLLIIRNGKVLVEDNWPLGPGSVKFRLLVTYGQAPDGALLEDVASQQKSFIAILAGIAVDKHLLDVTRSVTSYLGAGWSKAAPEQESRITVLNLLQMNSGLNVDLTYEAPPGERFRYNTPAYSITNSVLVAATGIPLEQLTREWLTEPLGMTNTSWRKRPAALAAVGNTVGLVTTPRDEAALGEMILHDGVGPNGKQVISPAQLHAMFTRSPTNPAYGRLWWLNGGSYAIRPSGHRVDGQLIPAAPPDTVAALGYWDRKLYVVPSAQLIVVRLGQQATDKDFDQQLWRRLSAALHLGHD